MAELAQFEVDLSGIGTGTVLVNGTDVSAQVRAFQINAQAGEIPRVILEGNTLDTKIRGEGIVAIQIPGVPIAAVIRSLDARDVENAALERQQWDDKSLVEHILDVIAEAADATES